MIFVLDALTVTSLLLWTSRVSAWNVERTRRDALKWIATSAVTTTATSAVVFVSPRVAHAAEQPVDVEEFIRTGTVSMPMGVSGQAGKSRPETGVVLREGTEVSRDARTGDVSAEILLRIATNNDDMIPVFTSFVSPWPLATGTIFDVECRDTNTGEGAFLAVSPPLTGDLSLESIPDSYFVNELTKSKGRFSLYGQPTDVKVKNSELTRDNKYRQFDLSFSTLSQSTQAEIPRRARAVVTIPEGTNQAVMLVASASASRWKNGGEKAAAVILNSFQAIPAPSTALKIRPKSRPSYD